MKDDFLKMVEDCPGARLKCWEDGEPCGPWYVYLFPTNRCNLKCTICWQRSVDIDYSAEMSDDRLLALVDECAELGAREWAIVGGGEPMLRDDLIIRLCERIREHGMNGRVHTNGTRFKLEHFARLIDIGWHSVAFSVDGATEEINDTIRSRGSFEKATQNMRAMAAMRRERGVQHPLLILSAVVTHQNIDTLDQYVTLGHDLGCDVVTGGHLTSTGDNTNPFHLTQEDIVRLPEYVNKAAQCAQTLGITSGFETLLDVPAEESKKKFPPLPPLTETGMMKTPCFEPWTTVQILADGKVGPCCVFWDTEADNVQNKPLRDIWFGAYFQKLREKMMRGKFEPYCVNCHSSLRSRDLTLREGMAYFRKEWDELLAVQKRIKEKETLNSLSLPKRALYLLTKSMDSTRKHGIKNALQRGMQWWNLYMQLRREKGRK